MEWKDNYENNLTHSHEEGVRKELVCYREGMSQLKVHELTSKTTRIMKYEMFIRRVITRVKVSVTHGKHAEELAL